MKFNPIFIGKPMVGIYFLSLAGEVIYIGQSENIMSRVGAHARNFYFDSISYMPCEKKDLNVLEKRYIDAMGPKLNKRITATWAGRRKPFNYPKAPEGPAQYALQTI